MCFKALILLLIKLGQKLFIKALSYSMPNINLTNSGFCLVFLFFLLIVAPTFIANVNVKAMITLQVCAVVGFRASCIIDIA